MSPVKFRSLARVWPKTYAAAFYKILFDCSRVTVALTKRFHWRELKTTPRCYARLVFGMPNLWDRPTPEILRFLAERQLERFKSDAKVYIDDDRIELAIAVLNDLLEKKEQWKEDYGVQEETREPVGSALQETSNNGPTWSGPCEHGYEA